MLGLHNHLGTPGTYRGYDEVYEVFNKYYKVYDEWYTRNYYVWLSECLCIKSLGITGLVLDVGVGTGVFRDCMDGDVVGIDPALKPLTLAYRRGVDPVLAFGEYLPFRGGVFDWVVLVVTLCFLKDPLRVLQEVHRVLKPEGSIAVCFIPKESELGRYYLTKMWRGESVFYRYARFYSITEVLNLLFKAGFRFVEYVSTLCRGPRTPPALEFPVRGLVSDCGFVCIKGIKRG